MSLKALKGFKDILPGEVETWQEIEACARSTFQRYGFKEIKVPILEQTELFARSIGEATDIVEKEMYSFNDRNGVSVTMRPEGTAPVLRSFIEHGLYVKQPVQKLFTIGPMFRHERPQKGRLRQFHQMSVEVLGSSHPLLDAEIMAMAVSLLQKIGISASLEINSLGCPACRPAFKDHLLSFLSGLQEKLCDNCERRRSTNPLRVLDCKSDNCQALYRNAPSILDHLCNDCEEHFSRVRRGLDMLDIQYSVNSFMVRGLDYYTRTTFELITNDLGAQSAVGAGGRYDGLVAQLGGPKVAGSGFAMGMERLVLLLNQKREQEGHEEQGVSLDVFVAALGEEAREKGFMLVHQLRGRGLRAAMDHEGRSLKSQMKLAARLGSIYTLILGENELHNKEAVLRDMAAGEQETIALPGDLADWGMIICERIG